METAQAQFTARLGATADFEKLEQIMQLNSKKLQLIWSNYAAVAARILADQNLGKFVYVETASGEVVGFLFVTYEWSDWRDGIFFWLQACEVNELYAESVLPLLKQKLEEYANSDLGYRWCGLRLCNEKTKSKHFESAVKTFELGKSHYFIFHVDTVAEPQTAASVTSNL